MAQGILENETVLEHKGKYSIELHIPESSSLVNSEVEKILKVASWDSQDYNCFEGGRSVLLKREAPYSIKGFNLNMLEVGGIGYREFESKGSIGYIKSDGKFLPPSLNNFLEGGSKGFMRTSKFVNGKIIDSTINYRPTGLYSYDELQRKVVNTDLVSKLGLKSCGVPTIDAYGFYNEKGWKDENGRYGFIVSSVPDQMRLITDVIERSKSLEGKSLNEILQFFNSELFAGIRKISMSLKELHENGYSHMQPHLSNVYFKNSELLLVDWSTLTELVGSDGIGNMALDLKKPLDAYLSSLKANFEFENKEVVADLAKIVISQIWSAYSGEYINNYDVNNFILKYSEQDLTVDVGALFVMFIKELGAGRKIHKKNYLGSSLTSSFERGSEHDVKSKLIKLCDPTIKVGRNSPCPCGSGKKFKKCGCH